MLISAVQMWQSEQEDPNIFPKELATIAPYVEGSTDKLSKQSDGTTAAHSIAGGQLKSVFKATAGNNWTYPTTAATKIQP